MAVLASIVASSVAVFQITGPTMWQKEAPALAEANSVPWSEPTIGPPSPWVSAANPVGESDEAARLVSWLYDFKDFQAVAALLREYKKLVPLLVEAYGQIRLRFGVQSTLALEPFHDPEAPSDYGLVALIRVQLTPERAQKLMDDLDMAWWLDALPRADHKLTIALEYA